MPSPEHQALVAALQEGGSATDAPTVEEQRANYEAMLGANPMADDVTVDEISIEHVNADWVSVPQSRAGRVILYLHGGGYMIGSNKAYREYGGRLARAAEARVCVLDYRLAPEHPFPAAVDDAVMAYQWLLNEGVQPNQIVIAGDSAGGGLTLATLFALRDAALALPAGAALLSPWVDLEGTGASSAPGAVDDPLVSQETLQNMSAAYAAGDLRNPLVSPLQGDFSGLPPLLIQVGTREILLDDAVRTAEKAKAAGVEVSYFAGEDLIHVWPVLIAGAPESIAAVAQIGDFVITRTSR